MPRLPDPSGDIVLRPHTIGSLIVELLAATVGVAVAVDGLSRGSALAVLGGTLWALAFGVGGVIAMRRSTKLNAAGVTICDGLRTRHLSWPEVERFELLPHRRGRRDHIVIVTPEGQVAMPHGDSKSLALRIELSLHWYQALVSRLEAVRARYQ